MNSWIPLTSNKYPPVGVSVQVTYLGCDDGKPYCDEFAYNNGHGRDDWRWSSDNSDVEVRILAWRYNDDAYNPSNPSYQNGYNTAVRRCVSDEYVRVSKELQSTKLKYSEVYEQLHDKSISHSDYLDKEKYLKILQNDIQRLEVELNTWDAAREICLNVVDGG